MRKLLLLLCCMQTAALFAQKTFIATAGFASFPVVDSKTYTKGKNLTGHSGQTKFMVNSPDGNYIYFETIVFNPTFASKIYKVDANTGTYMGNLSLKYGAQDLDMTSDGNYLFWHAGSIIYKMSTATMTLVDSMMVSTVGAIEVADSNTVYFNNGNTYIADFKSHSLTDSAMQTNGNMELALNESKTKLYMLKSLPKSMVVLDVASMTVDTTVSLATMEGSVYSIITHGSRVYIHSSGSSTVTGMVRVIDQISYNTVADVSTPYGEGVMSVDPNGMLWAPSNSSNEVSVIDLSTNTVDTVLDITKFGSSGPFSQAFGNGSVSGIVNGHETFALNIYPNPSRGVFYSDKIVSLKVYDSRGCLVADIRNNSQFDLGHLPAGLYLAVAEAEGKISRLKLVLD